MVTGSRKTRGKTSTRARADNSGRVPYRFTADQVLNMVTAGIFPDDQDVELWDGVIYLMTKYEPHNAIVGQIADLIRSVTPAGYFVREEKSAAYEEHSLPEPDVAICQGARFDYLPNVAPLAKMELVVEVNASTQRADHVDKLAGYAAARVPTYWIVDVEKRQVVVCTGPTAAGEYDQRMTRRPGDGLDVVIAGAPRGRIAVADLFPPAS
jgi:Uma2 family endonuclease